MLKRIPNYIKYIFTNVFFLFVFCFLFRIIFYRFFAQLDEVTANEIEKAFYLGIRFDIKLAVISIFPLAALVLILNYKFFRRKIYRVIANIYLVIAYLTITLFYLFDLCSINIHF